MHRAQRSSLAQELHVVKLTGCHGLPYIPHFYLSVLVRPCFESDDASIIRYGPNYSLRGKRTRLKGFF